MKNITTEELKIINSLNKPIDNIDMSLVNSIINKLLDSKNYIELINFLNNLHDFSTIPSNILDILLNSDKECIASLLENEDILYFLTEEEKDRLKNKLSVSEANIKLNESYDCYYDLLFKQGIRPRDEKKISDNIVEHTFTRANQIIGIKLKEVKDIGVVVSYIDYKLYNLPKDKQLLKEIDYINEFGFDVNKDNLIEL